MNCFADLVAGFYDDNAENEWLRMDRHRTEFAVTLRALQEHLPPPPARLLDCGGGPGRYAIELMQRGYTVTLFDLSEGNLRLAREKALEAGVELAGHHERRVDPVPRDEEVQRPEGGREHADRVGGRDPQREFARLLGVRQRALLGFGLA